VLNNHLHQQIIGGDNMQVLQVNLGPHQMATPKQHHIINMTQIGWNNQTNINIINND